MLNKLIPYLDNRLAELSYFGRLYGLAEKIREGKEEKAQEFPAVWSANGNYEQVELEQSAGYHRMYSERQFTELTGEEVMGCSKAFELTYPMVFVGCLKHSAGCDTYETDSLANSAANKLYQKDFDKTIRSQVRAISIKVFLKSISTDRDQIWDEEYANVPKAMTFDMIYFAIKYELKIRADSSCLKIIEC